jgi:hypothetical protein
MCLSEVVENKLFTWFENRILHKTPAQFLSALCAIFVSIVVILGVQHRGQGAFTEGKKGRISHENTQKDAKRAKKRG